MILQSDAIILKRAPWSNTSWVLWAFSREHGAIRSLARGARRQNKRRPQKGPDLFALGEMVYYRRAGSELSNMAEWDELSDFAGLRLRTERLFTAGHIAREIIAATEEGAPIPKLFDALLDAWQQLEEGVHTGLVLASFRLRALEVLGHAPVLGHCAVSGETLPAGKKTLHYNADEGGVVASQHAKPSDPLFGAEALALARTLADGTLPAGLRVSKKAGAELDRCLGWHMAAAAGSSVPLKTRRRRRK